MRSLNSKRTVDFTKGPITKPLLLFALPMLFGNILQQMYSITDSIIVGRFLGDVALAAIGASSPVVRLSISMIIGFTLGVSVVISHYFGAHDDEGVRKAVATCCTFFFYCSIAISIIGYIATPYILKSMATPPDAMEDAIRYLRVSFIGSLLMIGYNVVNSVFRGLGNSKLPLYMLLLSTLLNVVLDVFFVFALRLGVAGSAWATVISQGIAFMLSFAYFQRMYKEYAFSFRSTHFYRGDLFRILKIGVPSGVKGSMYWLGFVLITGVVNSYGAFAIAAFSTASKIDSFVQTPMIALSSSLSTYVAQNVGAKQECRIKKGVRVSILLSLLFAFVMTVSVFFFAEKLMHLFTENESVIELGSQYLKIVSVLYIIYVLQEVPQGVAIGCGDTLWLMLSTICAMWVVRLPLCLILSNAIGLKGVWLSMPSGWFVALLFCGGYYISGYWKKRVV